jgi:hypothetical protein
MRKEKLMNNNSVYVTSDGYSYDAPLMRFDCSCGDNFYADRQRNFCPVCGGKIVPKEVDAGGEYYEWDNGFCSYFINVKTGKRKFSLGPNDILVEHAVDDFMC